MKINSSHIERASIFAKAASMDPQMTADVSFETFQDLCFRGGIPDTPGIRAACYRILFRYMPLEKAERVAKMEEKRNLYFEYLKDFTTTGDEESNQSQLTLEQIDKDVRRTLPDFSFFQQQTKVPVGSRLHPGHETSVYKTSRKLFAKLKVAADFGSRSHLSTCDSEDPLFELGRDFHWEVIERILFVYTELNRGIGYVQGMNEILGPLYYIFATDPNDSQQSYAEPDAFWVFFTIMSEVKEMYMKSMDNDLTTGITAKMTNLFDMLELKDPELKANLDAKALHPAYFSFRWLSLLLAQEFALPDLLRIWDSLFADRKRFSFLINFCCSMLICVRDELISGSFNENVALLQSYPLTDLNTVLEHAFISYDEDRVEEGMISMKPLKITTKQQAPRDRSPSGRLQQQFQSVFAAPIEGLSDALSPHLQTLSDSLSNFWTDRKKSPIPK